MHRSEATRSVSKDERGVEVRARRDVEARSGLLAENESNLAAGD
jgi:hypothetical protein